MSYLGCYQRRSNEYIKWVLSAFESVHFFVVRKCGRCYDNTIENGKGGISYAEAADYIFEEFLGGDCE